MPKQTEKKAKITLNNLLASMPDLYLILNPKYEIEEVSKAFEIATNVKRKEILGQNIFNVFPSYSKEENAATLKNLRNSLDKVLKSKKPDVMSIQKYDIKIPGTDTFQERYWSPVNSPILNKNNEVQYIIHRAQDVTQFIQKKQGHAIFANKDTKKDIGRLEADLYLHSQEIEKANALLRASEQRLRLMIEGTKDYAILMLDPNGYIATWNEGAERIKGYKADEIIGKHFSVFYTQEARDKKHPEYELKVAKEEGRYEEEGWRIRKDGSKFWANVIITPIYDKQENLLGFGKVTRDLTERRRIETLKNEFISVVSHELRTPLTSIKGSVSLLIGGAAGELTEKAKKLLDIANSNCDRLVRLINDILDIEKIEAGKMQFNFQTYDLGKLVTEAISINQMYGEKFGVKIICPKIISPLNVKVDTDRLMQVLTNLISNAVKFSDRKGDVVITMTKLNNTARIAVTNQGIGISDKFKENIFERFSQADASTTRQKSGTGLGLAISRAIMEKLGGEIYFTSIPNQETTFYIDLPLLHEDKKGIEKITSLPVAGDNTILICEDDEEQAEYLSTMLQGAGYQTDVCYTASQAKRLLIERKYYALLLDLILPDMNGVDLIKELRSKADTQKVPIIVISVFAKDTKETQINGGAVQVVDWLDKPIDFIKLSKAFTAIKENIGHERPRILHVEDDIEIQKIINNLFHDRAEILPTDTVQASQEVLKYQKFDLVILDLLLLDGDGIDLLPIIAEKGIPVIVFSQTALDPKYAHYVNQSLIKSKTSPERLLNIFNKFL